MSVTAGKLDYVRDRAIRRRRGLRKALHRLRRRRPGSYHPTADHPTGEDRMISATRTAAALVAGAAMLGAAHIVTAEESGSVRLIRTYVQDYTTIEHGDARYTGGPLEGAVTILESSGGPFVAGTHERITCVVYAKSTAAGIDLDAPCTMTAPSGDMWYTHSKRRSGDVETGGGGPGTMEILGGTGVYAGITGSCTYDVGYLPDGWVAMIADCTWLSASSVR